MGHAAFHGCCCVRGPGLRVAAVRDGAGCIMVARACKVFCICLLHGLLHISQKLASAVGQSTHCLILSLLPHAYQRSVPVRVARLLMRQRAWESPSVGL